MNSNDPIGMALNASGTDVEIGPRGFRFTRGAEAVAQRILVRLRNIKGEWFLDLENGVPWFQSILGSKFSEPEIRGIVADVIGKTPGVTETISLIISFDASTRRLDISFETSTVFEDTVTGSLSI